MNTEPFSYRYLCKANPLPLQRSSKPFLSEGWTARGSIPPGGSIHKGICMTDRKRVCPKCGNSFSTRGGNYSKHVNSCDGAYKKFEKSTHCKWCGMSFEGLNASERANHSRWCEENPDIKQKKLHPGKQLSCSRCGIQFCLINPKDRKTTCSIECQRTHTNESKQNLSKIRSAYLAKNPDAHVWKRSSKFRSKPCENVKQVLYDKNICFVEEYTPSTERHFAIDIAFPDIKFGIEVNGNQHYKSDGSLNDYYQERHEFLEKLGWTIIEVHYSKCFTSDSIEKILDFDTIMTSQLDEYTIEKYLKPKPLKPKRSRAEANRQRHQHLYDKWESAKDVIFEHGIDFSRYGWSSKVADVLGILPQKVSIWMKKYHPEFYETMCFKRK